MKSKVDWFSGEEILVEDMGHLNDALAQNDRGLASDLWRPGIVKDPNGLSNFAVSVDSTTNTLINVGWGVAYSNGYRIAIESDKTYVASDPFATTNGVCTPQSSGNRAIPLANYAAGQSNFVWAQYLEVSRTNPRAVSTVDSSVHYPHRDHGYRVVVNTTNSPGNPNGLTNAVFLATVFGRGSGAALAAAPNGITDIGRAYLGVLAKDSVGTAQLIDASVTPQKMDQTANYTFNGLCVSTLIGSSNITVPIYPLLPTSAASRRYAQYAGWGVAASHTVFRPTFDQNYNLAFMTVEGPGMTGTITPVYDGLCNITQVNEVIDGMNVSHLITYQTVNGASLVASVTENGA